MQDMEYKEALVDNAPTISQNAMVSKAQKVEDNVLQMMTMPVIALQPTVPSNLVPNLPCTLFNGPNALIFKQVRLLSSKLEAMKL